jgi:hypothetical protein
MLATKQMTKIISSKTEKQIAGNRKSKTTLFWEKYPNGVLKIVDIKAVLR